jgi:hypothetical protein
MLPRGAKYSFSDGYTTRLPNPRKISTKFHTAKNVSDRTKHTHMFMQFAQFVDHDVVAVHNFGEGRSHKQILSCRNKHGHDIAVEWQLYTKAASY